MTDARAQLTDLLAPYEHIDRELSAGYVILVPLPLLQALAAEAAPRPEGLTRERLAEIVSDSLAATTEGTDFAEAPEPSDEPGSPYVLRLTNEILARLG